MEGGGVPTILQGVTARQNACRVLPGLFQSKPKENKYETKY
jgi:hypothetical protein